jgi:hypothetical protein
VHQSGLLDGLTELRPGNVIELEERQTDKGVEGISVRLIPQERLEFQKNKDFYERKTFAKKPKNETEKEVD